jgi:hypothetical protein
MTHSQKAKASNFQEEVNPFLLHCNLTKPTMESLLAKQRSGLQNPGRALLGDRFRAEGRQLGNCLVRI